MSGNKYLFCFQAQCDTGCHKPFLHEDLSMLATHYSPWRP